MVSEDDPNVVPSLTIWTKTNVPHGCWLYCPERTNYIQHRLWLSRKIRLGPAHYRYASSLKDTLLNVYQARQFECEWLEGSV